MEQSLGQLAALKIGTTPPTNTNMIWFDTNVGQFVHKSFNPNTSAWEPIGGAGSGDNSYVRVAPTTVAVGGLPVGYVPNGTIQDLLDNMLYPFLAPSFTAFALQGFSLLELGDQIGSGPQTFTWATAQSGNIQANSLEVIDLISGSLAAGLPNTGSALVTIPAPVVNNVPASSRTYRIRGTNTQAATFQRDYTVTWQPRRITGSVPDAEVATLLAANSIADVLAVPGISVLSNVVAAGKFTGNLTYDLSGSPAPGRRIFWLYDASYGNSSFLQGAFAFPVNTPVDRSLTNAFGAARTYRIYTSFNPSSALALTVTVS